MRTYIDNNINTEHKKTSYYIWGGQKSNDLVKMFLDF